MTTGPLVPGAVNLRDVGGLPAQEGRTRAGVLYRAGQPGRLGASGRAALAGLRLRRVIDLRADEEIASAPSVFEGLGVTVQRVPLFLGSVGSFFADDVSLSELYRHIVDDAAPAVVEVVRGIVADQPVLIQCTAGKDRTGVTVALTLAAAGVDEEAVVADYARTETFLPVRRSRAVLGWLRAQHPDARNLEDLVSRSPAPVMRELLGGLSARFGSAAGYLEAHGLEPDELRELRRVLIERGESSQHSRG
ncbi:tyrosine-protein phosphatase [Microbacterium ulmi]|uniref:Tyrosine-protein phosphatase n=1 Tax=Microbacterium ulmi TaxID=179095 RepID=A0A7Y2M2B0_9MICO|nr:tyrosine-protein phosphatase [Microbacterium ulmi]NII70460.1 protein-tyrosine phosphatase [Microbacterium ulmi]NNH04449.1 tyrosine-protein phosphatase [Microbacterium ulmi]